MIYPMNIKRNIIFSLESRKKNGVAIVDNVPIRMRVVYGGQRIEFTTGYRIDLAKWDVDRQRVRNGCTNKLKQSASDINSDLNKYSTDIQAIFKEYEVQSIIPTPKQLKDNFNERQNKDNRSDQADKLVNIFDEFIRESSKQNNWTQSTIQKLTTVKNHLGGFDKSLTYDSLSLDVLAEYVNYLHGIDMRNNSINKQINLLKWFLRWGVEKGYSKNNVFESFKPKLKTTAKKVIFLSWDELIQLQEYKIPETKKYLDRVRDVFLFCCYTGLRYSDVYNLKRSDIKNNYIEVTTIKTADSLTIELNNYSREILDKYRDIYFENSKVLPVISNQKMNDYIKELAELANINEVVRETYYKGNQRIDEVVPKYTLLGTHAGRRTFICNALAMGIPAQTVMKWTGHSDYKAMKPYVDIADKDKQEAMTLWDKKDINDTDKLLEQLKEIPKDKLAEILEKLNTSTANTK